MLKRKYPLTSGGVETKIYRLYRKDDNRVFREADYVENDFFGWLENNFELTESQATYMYSLGIEFAIQNGSVLAYCFRHRLSVTLVKGDKALRSSKFIRREENVEVTAQPGQDDLVSGGVNYFIS
ncbi:hypothetical protein [Sphingobacterium detergens]|uniref:Uncharacterized protein n=1 Tax=Sphingobacterium detergens TaxID=1145106 RepID=A0A420AQY6_SPHD1|nr:hypothetical protein [Sphingobacterium detergens]RKE46850.1 hypothetical protein DFQ12_4006 [Sphingobacterium detergens]